MIQTKSQIVYWVADCLTDRPAYSIRARTRKECAALRASDNPLAFEKPRKIVVKYESAFDLICKCLGEGGVE